MADAVTKSGTEPQGPASLPPNTKVVYIEKQSAGRVYSGDFTFKRLTIGELGRLGADIARRNGGLPVDDTTERVNIMLAHFAIGITDAPKWWNPEELYDLSLVREVFEQQMKFEASFRPALQKQAEASPSDS